MSATLITPPVSPAYNGNDLWITLESDLVNTAAKGYVNIISQLPGEPILGETFLLSWGGQSVLLTVEATKNSAATAIPLRMVGESMDDYAIRWAEALRENHLISASFDITTHFVGRIKLTYRISGFIDISVLENITSTETNLFDGVDPNTETNLAAQLEIWKPSDYALDPHILLARLHGTYNAVTGQTEFNLKGLFPVSPALPEASSIGSSISFTWKHGDATSAAIEYYLRYADKYGSPAIPEALLRTEGNFIALHGARPEDHDNVVLTGTAARDLHGYRTANQIFKKPVTDVQPDWFYLFANQEMTDCRVEFEIMWTDGSTTTETPAAGIGTLAANKAHWIRSTPYDTGAIAPPVAGELPWKYIFRLLGDAGDGEITLAEVNYIIRPCTDWDIYLLMDNGLGGCESVLFRGKTNFGNEVTRETARRARTSDFNINEGEIINFNSEGQKVLELNTGWHDLYYIQHLQQLLYGHVWRIDTVEKRFLKMLVETSSVNTDEDDSELYSLNIKLKPAWIDYAQNP